MSKSGVINESLLTGINDAPRIVARSRRGFQPATPVLFADFSHVYPQFVRVEKELAAFSFCNRAPAAMGNCYPGRD